ncbi:MAG: hypothetical protein ACK5C3_03830 [bacterium]
MDGYFLTADLLGFSSIVSNSNANELPTRIGAWISLVDSAAQDAGVEKIQLISDTVFAGADSSAEGLTSLVAFARNLLNRGVCRSLPVRGAIAHGSFEWGNLTYGKAVIQSHQLESKQNWIGIACEQDLLHAEKLWHHDCLVCYPPPLKAGRVTLNPVVAWAVPQFEDLAKSLTSNGLAREEEQLGWPWAQKISNTVEFGSYLKIIRESRSDPSKFSGRLPIEALALNIRPVPVP